MIIETGRFGQLTVGTEGTITIPQGILGFPEYTRFCLIDPADDTLILWLQSLDNPQVVFPVLEPKVFRLDYTAKLSALELRELKLDNVNQSAVLSILTIPEDITQMSANLKAPLVVNLKEQIAKQVVLQENEYSVKHLMFKELRTHLLTIRAQERASIALEAERAPAVVSIRDIPPSLTVKPLLA
ncbi:flagellar assembly protein FliW [bacterium]|nr:flagellar assembly protein FliW [bacterium]